MSFMGRFVGFLGIVTVFSPFLGANEPFLFNQSVPLMPGLRIAQKNSPPSALMNEQVVHAESDDGMDEGEVIDYYKNHLNNKGWSVEGDGTFVRSGESLTLEISTKENHLMVHFHYHQKIPTP